MKKLVIIPLMLLAAGAASAQSWDVSGDSTYSTAVASITSATTLKSVPAVSPKHKMYVFTRAAAAESATLVFQTKTGTTLATQAVAVGTDYAATTLSAPLYFQRVRVSPTTLTGAESISVTIVQMPDAGF